MESVDWFLERFEAAAECKQATDGNKVCQLINLIPSEADLRDVEEMEGYSAKDWGQLREEILEKWGS